MSDPVDLPGKATPYGPGDPVEAFDVAASGGTFAERKAAREAADEADEQADDKAAKSKAVKGDDAENKAVGRKQTTRR